MHCSAAMLLFSPFPCSRFEQPPKTSQRVRLKHNSDLPWSLWWMCGKRQQTAKGRRNTARRRNGEKTRRFIQFHSRQEEIASCQPISSKQHKATQEAEKYGTYKRLTAYFSRAWLSDGTGVPLPLGNIVLCGRTPAFSFFFRYFICQTIAAANRTPPRSNDSTEPGPGEEAGPLQVAGLLTNENAKISLRPAFQCSLFTVLTSIASISMSSI